MESIPTFIEASIYRRPRGRHGQAHAEVDQRDIMTSFDDLENTSAYDIAQALATIGKGGPSIPAAFIKYAKTAMNAFQQKPHGVSKLGDLEVTGTFAQEMKTSIQLADHWGDVVAALDMSRPENVSDVTSTRQPRDPHDMFSPFEHGHDASRVAEKPTRDDRNDMVKVKSAVRGIIKDVITQLNDFETWTSRSQGLSAAFNTQLAFDALQTYLRMVARVSSDYPLESFVQQIVAMTATLRPDIPMAQLTFGPSSDAAENQNTMGPSQ